MANNIALAEKYTSAIDEVIQQEGKVGVLNDPAFKALFVGTHTVQIPSMTFTGLGNYGRVNGGSGYAKGDTNLAWEDFTLTQDRSRQLYIDAGDVEETGIAGLIGKTVKEYMKQHVAPEIDAYCLSKLWSTANTAGHKKAYAAGTSVADFISMCNSVESANGFANADYISFVDETMWRDLQTSPELTRQITISNFGEGKLNFKVFDLNGFKIVPVSAARMKTAYTFNAGASPSAGGFTAAPGAQDVRAIALPVGNVHLVKKVDKVKIFNPDVVQDADAYKVDFHIYYDLVITKNKKDTIYTIATEA